MRGWPFKCTHFLQIASSDLFYMSQRLIRPHNQNPNGHNHFRSLQRFLRVLGPGFVTGASDDDPSGIGTYAVAGATFGFATLWTALVTFPLMATVQFICAKIGM